MIETKVAFSVGDFIVDFENPKDLNKELKEKAKNFLQATVGKRLEIVADIIENKDRPSAIAFMEEIIKELAKSKEKNRRNKIAEILKLRSYLNDRSSSLKIILEHCSTVL